MTLPESDNTYLTERKINYAVSSEGNMLCIVLKEFALPTGYNHKQSDLLIRLKPGYPDVPPDMWWFDPHVQLLSGATIEATQNIEQYLGRSWQRWSRHFSEGQWLSGIDNLESFLALIRKELERCTLVETA